MANQNTNPVTEAELQQIRELHAQGKGRNEISRIVGRSLRTISVHAEQLGLTFDRTATAVATEARKVDAKARRTAIIERAYSRVEKLLDHLDAAERGQFKFTTGTVNGIETQSLDHVPGQEEKALAGAITQYLNQAVKLEQLDGDPGVDAARSMLGSLAEGLNKLAGLDGGGDDSGEG
ncbi:helix-turn-helix domain containing protein [Streptomyces coelicoflavus]|uniref:helix-turn-helix domain containing protein n=1 Tax=Streptomyces coelicoflavus TaxID=285562 RepID=UPI000D59FA21|nr:helix-turn-helix domain containing protein [Streptomyces coelicoflavus]